MADTTAATTLIGILQRMDRLTNWEKRAREEMDVGLDPIRDLLRRLGDPQNCFRSIHVTGTKGKGSVCALVGAALDKAGWRVGVYASPHVQSITERISIAGAPIGEGALVRTLSSVLDACDHARTEDVPAARATWFDIMTAAAFVAFREAQIEWAVVEVGMGGRLDSTNVIASDVCVITNIELEHTEVLGNTREAIAREKAGILRRGSCLVTSLAADESVGRFIDEYAASMGCPVFRINPEINPSIAHINAELAGLVLDQLGERGVLTRSHAALARPVGSWLLDKATCEKAKLPGRLERFDIAVSRAAGLEGYRIPVILDGAHVPFNLAAVMQELHRRPEFTAPCIAVVALAADKDVVGFLKCLVPHAFRVVCTEVRSSGRSYPATDLNQLATSLGLNSEVEPDPARAFVKGLELAAKSDRWLLVTGSLGLIGAIRGTAIKMHQCVEMDRFEGDFSSLSKMTGPQRV
ncbi:MULTISPECIES: bifunctional folylpolyglutamate synthase/dihydrofolate synthase [unclassified Bradyrhizobium]|uniref:bifunctional folylpolyglutamate synthase/dihydrofolate synthase n=1 Tax=unclassified Bradyrhizobium TaxID=2631580 RepID=UPI0028EF9EF1|nr:MULTISPECIES: Mur ligase family protein [unclassified Bradyrhizobium]